MDDHGELTGRFYSMGEIERITGIPAATIRAWERRYGVPRPGRSSGRHRLYSEQDLSLLKWLIARQQEGMSISRAVSLWRHQASLGTAPSPESAASAAAAARGGLEELRSAWISACLRYDRKLAQSILAQAFALYPPQEVCVQLLLNGLSEIGDRWFRGEASVQQEHFASAIAVHQVERLIAATSPWRRERVLLACPPGELHSFGLLFLALLLRQRGLDAVFLGANVPVEEIDAAVAEIRPDLAVLSAQRLPDAAGLIRMAGALQRTGIPVGYGGLIFNSWPELRDRVPGYFLGETIPGAPDAAERLLSGEAEAIEPPPPQAENDSAARCFLSRLPAIEANVRLAMAGTISDEALMEANRTVSSHIVAGLAIGDLSPLNAGRPWLEATFRNMPDPVGTTRSYLSTYSLAAQTQMSDCDGPALAWLRDATSS